MIKEGSRSVCRSLYLPIYFLSVAIIFIAGPGQYLPVGSVLSGFRTRSSCHAWSHISIRAILTLFFVCLFVYGFLRLSLSTFMCYTMCQVSCSIIHLSSERLKNVSYVPGSHVFNAGTHQRIKQSQSLD